MAFKTRCIDCFTEVVLENNLEDEFMRDTFEDFFDDNLNNYTKSAAKERNYFVEAILKCLKSVYGDRLSQKMQIAYKNRKITYMDFYKITRINKGENPEKQATIMEEIIDLYDDNTVIAIHRTGGYSGERLNEEGIKLTGHTSSGVVNHKNLVYILVT